MASKVPCEKCVAYVTRGPASKSHLLISLGDFVAEVSTSHSAGDSGQGLAVAATHLTAQQSAEHCAHANSERAILRNRCRFWV